MKEYEINMAAEDTAKETIIYNHTEVPKLNIVRTRRLSPCRHAVYSCLCDFWYILKLTAIFFVGMQFGMHRACSTTQDLIQDAVDKILEDLRQMESKKPESRSDSVISDDVFWGTTVEDALPVGYDDRASEAWEDYVDGAVVVKMEAGCGRMQNRLVTFEDGRQACVRYRQNTDQIQGEIFSYYVAKLLNLTNVAPSVIKIVDVKEELWKNVRNDIGAAQWNSNRAVVLTEYVPSLQSATIPDIFKPKNRHLNKDDVYKMIGKTDLPNSSVLPSPSVLPNPINNNTLTDLVELAQWSDLIVFDFLTANLDRIVNNLFNFQWNVNIMDGPAHNLAKKSDNGLLVFLDNESGLLHGYRLLKKYNVYHSLMLDNLCVYRRTTIDALKDLHNNHDVGQRLHNMFLDKNDAVIRDILPQLPEKNVKILHERLVKVLVQVSKCEQLYTRTPIDP